MLKRRYYCYWYYRSRKNGRCMLWQRRRWRREIEANESSHVALKCKDSLFCLRIDWSFHLSIDTRSRLLLIRWNRPWIDRSTTTMTFDAFISVSDCIVNYQRTIVSQAKLSSSWKIQRCRRSASKRLTQSSAVLTCLMKAIKSYSPLKIPK